MAYNSGILESHEAVVGEDKTHSSQPTNEEKELAKQIDKLFDKHLKHRRKYDKDWVDNYKMYRGEQWLKRRPTYKSREVINMIFQAIQSQHATMMDVRPVVGFSPRDPSDLEFSEILSQLFEADWQRHGWMDELSQIILDGHIYGVGYGYCSYDEDLNQGRGGIKWCADDPFNHYPSPEATDVNKNSRVYIHAKPEEVDTLKSRYAGHRFVDQIKPDLENLAYEHRALETLHRRKNTNLDMTRDTVSYSQDQDAKDDLALVITAYLLPSDTEEITKEDENNPGETIYITRKKYSRGRKVVKIGEFIFEDTELPYDDLEFPYQRYVNYALPREFFGMSEVDQTRGPQITFNKVVNFTIDFLTLMGNPVWMSPVESQVNTKKLTNQPGLIVEYANGQAPQRVEGPQLQPYVFELLSRLETWFNNLAGTQDVTRGINPTGVTANAAIENLLEQAQKRVKQKMRNEDSFLNSFGRQWVSRCMQYYTAPEIFRLTNKEGANKYFKFHVEHRETGEADIYGKPKTQKFAVVRPYVESPGGLIPGESVNEYEIRGDFDVVVSTISGLPFSKAEKETKLLNLFDRGLLDSEEVLKQLDYPNYEQILTRIQQQQAAAAQSNPPAA